MLHRNPQNQAIDRCIICEAQEAIEELREAVKKLMPSGE
jgi:hypothetical protein